MAGDKKSSGGGTDIWWFLGLLGIFFLLWMSTGGPERAKEQGLDKIRVGQKYDNQSGEWKKRNETPTTPLNGEPRYSGDGQIIY